MTRSDVITAAALLGLGACLLPGVLRAKTEKARQTKCGNNLRQLGLAAIQYGDDKRFLPHNGRILSLDGDASTNHTPKVVRALLWYGYHDNPAGWVCPSSDDRSLVISDDGVKENMRKWFWGRKSKQASMTRSPWVDGAADPTLTQTTELSYGWTRRGMNRNVRSTAILGADRACRDGTPGVMQGNHMDGWNVLKADATVEYMRVTDNKGIGDIGEFLTGAQRGKGYLACRVQKAADVLKLKPKAGPKLSWPGIYSDGKLVVKLRAHVWDPYQRRQTFRGVLERGRRSFPLHGVAGKAELKGTMDGGRDMPITIVPGPDSIEIRSEGLKRTLKRQKKAYGR